jgi:hypothetical protein
MCLQVPPDALHPASWPMLSQATGSRRPTSSLWLRAAQPHAVTDSKIAECQPRHFCRSQDHYRDSKRAGRLGLEPTTDGL